MKSDPSEQNQIIKKLLDKTREGRVHWEEEQSAAFGEVRYVDSRETFRCKLGTDAPDSFSFEVGHDNVQAWLSMTDQRGSQIFRVEANDLPTSPEEEEATRMIDELYDLARRQVLRIDQKLVLASTLLDRV
jgi:hypothetical protein